MENICGFDQNVVDAFNAFAENYALAPGVNGEKSYMIGYIEKCNHLHADYWVEEWIPFTSVTYLPWGTLFIERWNKIKDIPIFSGSVCSLIKDVEVVIGDDQSIVEENRITRRATTLTITQLLDLAHPLFSDDVLGHFEGGVEEISIVKNAKIPSIKFS